MTIDEYVLMYSGITNFNRALDVVRSLAKDFGCVDLPMVQREKDILMRRDDFPYFGYSDGDTCQWVVDRVLDGWAVWLQVAINHGNPNPKGTINFNEFEKLGRESCEPDIKLFISDWMDKLRVVTPPSNRQTTDFYIKMSQMIDSVHRANPIHDIEGLLGDMSKHAAKK